MAPPKATRMTKSESKISFEKLEQTPPNKMNNQLALIQSLARQVKRVEEVLTCGICLELLKTPKVLVCGHNFCQLCIQDYLRKTNGISPQVAYQRKFKGTVVCPSCRCPGITRRNVQDDPRIERLISPFQRLLAALQQDTGVDLTTVRLDGEAGGREAPGDTPSSSRRRSFLTATSTPALTNKKSRLSSRKKSPTPPPPASIASEPESSVAIIESGPTVNDEGEQEHQEQSDEVQPVSGPSSEPKPANDNGKNEIERPRFQFAIRGSLKPREDENEEAEERSEKRQKIPFIKLAPLSDGCRQVVTKTHEPTIELDNEDSVTTAMFDTAKDVPRHESAATCSSTVSAGSRRKNRKLVEGGDLSSLMIESENTKAVKNDNSNLSLGSETKRKKRKLVEVEDDDQETVLSWEKESKKSKGEPEPEPEKRLNISHSSSRDLFDDGTEVVESGGTYIDSNPGGARQKSVSQNSETSILHDTHMDPAGADQHDDDDFDMFDDHDEQDPNLAPTQLDPLPPPQTDDPEEARIEASDDELIENSQEEEKESRLASVLKTAASSTPKRKSPLKDISKDNNEHFEEEHVDKTEEDEAEFTMDPASVKLIGSGLMSDNRKLMAAFAKMFGFGLVKDVGEATHVIVNHDDNMNADRTMKFLRAIIQRKWIVGISWISECLRLSKLVKPDDFEVNDNNGEPGPNRARISTEPAKLFQSLEVCVKGKFVTMTQAEFVGLLIDSGATVLRTITSMSFSSGTTGLVVVDNGNSGEQDHLNVFKSYSIATVGHDWVLDSLSACRILPITDYLKHDATVNQIIKAGYEGQYVFDN